MSLLNVFNDILNQRKTKKDLDRINIDKSHCSHYMATFSERVKQTLSKSKEKIVYIPFPKYCGSAVESLLEKEKIPYIKSNMYSDIDEKNALCVLFNVKEDYFTTMLDKI